MRTLNWTWKWIVESFDVEPPIIFRNNLIIAIADIDVTLCKASSGVIDVISHIPHLQPLQFDVEG